MRCACTSSSNLAARRGVPTVATNDVLFHVPARRILQDVVTCIRDDCTIDEPASAASAMPTAI